MTSDPQPSVDNYARQAAPALHHATVLFGLAALIVLSGTLVRCSYGSSPTLPLREGDRFAPLPTLDKSPVPVHAAAKFAAMDLAMALDGRVVLDSGAYLSRQGTPPSISPEIAQSLRQGVLSAALVRAQDAPKTFKIPGGGYARTLGYLTEAPLVAAGASTVVNGRLQVRFFVTVAVALYPPASTTAFSTAQHKLAVVLERAERVEHPGRAGWLHDFVVRSVSLVEDNGS